MRADFYTRFKATSEQRLAKQSLCVKLDEDIDALIRAKLKGTARGEWVRKVLREAALRDLSETSAWDGGN
jgi:hypothetical protein